jgi:hypothetical protein
MNDDNEEEEKEEAKIKLKQKEVPAGVFGSLKKRDGEETLGAKERFKRAKTNQ